MPATTSDHAVGTPDLATDRPARTPRRPRQAAGVNTSSTGMKALGYLGMLLVFLVIGVPLFWIVITSLKERGDIYTRPAIYWPSPVTGRAITPP